MSLLLPLLLAAPALAGEPFSSYVPPSGSFQAEVPSGWSALEIRSPGGLSAHILGPQMRRLRPAYHVHLYQKDAPGFTAPDELLRKARAADKSMGRESSGMESRRVSGRPAKVFEVRETRWLPMDSLPSEPAVIHRFYAFIADGEDLFVASLVVDEEEYESYRGEFRRFLKSMRLLRRGLP
jgi:hypothetical protein